MTDRTAGQHRTQTSLSDTLRWTNTTAESIPPYGVIQLKANYASGYNQASKPNGSTGVFFANGAVAVAAGKKGESLLWNQPRLVKVSGTPAVGDQVGPTDGSWEMSDSGTGFYVIHQPVDGVAAVVQVGGGGSDVFNIEFIIEEVVCNEDNSMTLVATPTWVTGGCSASLPGLDSYGNLEVEDPCSILTFYTADWLVGKKGTATYRYPYGETSGYCEGQWRVDMICGQPECA